MVADARYVGLRVVERAGGTKRNRIAGPSDERGDRRAHLAEKLSPITAEHHHGVLGGFKMADGFREGFDIRQFRPDIETDAGCLFGEDLPHSGKQPLGHFGFAVPGHAHIVWRVGCRQV